MKLITTLLIVLICISILPAQGGSAQHTVPPPVLLGDRVSIEVNLIDGSQPLDNMVLFFRMEGEASFRHQPMKREGMIYLTDFSTAGYHPGNLEYYFAYQDMRGNVKKLPELDPESNPFRLQIIPAKQKDTAASQGEMDILLLSPQPDLMSSSDELVIAFSLPLDIENPENLIYKLLVDGVPKPAERDGHLVSYAPTTIPSGPHNAEISVYNSFGKRLGGKSFSFRVSSKPSEKKGFSSNAHIFLDNRSQNIADNSDNFFRGGLRYTAGYKQFDLKTDILISSEESYNRQPMNRYSARLRYNFSSKYNLYIKGGDITNNFDPLAFWGKRIRGISLGMHTKYFSFDYTTGSANRAVEGKAVGDSITQYGTYKQKFLAIRPQFNVGKYFAWSFDLVNSKDNPKSIKYGANPKEALAVGSSIRLNLDNNRIMFKSSFMASMKNEDASGKIDADSVLDELSGSEKDLAKKYLDILESSGFLTLTTGLAPVPNIAMQVEGQLRYFNQSFRIIYKNIESDYVTPGNPYLQRDIRGLFISDNIRMLNNQVFLNVYFNKYTNNLADSDTETDNDELGGSISYFPVNNFPSLTLSYGSQTRLNGLGKENIDPDSTFLVIEDNSTQRIGVSSSYNFDLADLMNTLTLSFSKFTREDKIYLTNRSEFFLFNIGLRNRFSFPLTVRTNYAVSNSGFGEGDAEFKTDIQKYYVGADYLFKKSLLNSDLKPFFHLTFQKIKNERQFIDDTDSNRLNYTAGVNLRNTKFGNFSLRFDFIDYGDSNNTTGSIFSARYEVNL